MIAFCVDCRTALRGGHVCDPQHRVVDLETAYGRDVLARQVFEPIVAEQPQQRTLGKSLLTLLNGTAMAVVLLIVGLVLTYTGRPFFGIVAGVVAMSFIAFGGSREEKEHALRPSKKGLEHRVIGARAEPPWSEAPQRVVGTIVAATGAPSPFGRDECAGWALETSLAGCGVMLRDGETKGMSMTLDDGRSLSVPPGMLRLARRASSDSLDSDAVTAYVASLASSELIVWDEARAVVFRVGDRIELVATIVDRTEARYREVDESLLTTIDVPVVQRRP